MRFTLTIQCDNAAFDDDPSVEIARILKDAAERIEHGSRYDYPCIDVNGNTVGRYEYMEKE